MKSSGSRGWIGDQRGTLDLLRAGHICDGENQRAVAEVGRLDKNRWFKLLEATTEWMLNES